MDSLCFRSVIPEDFDQLKALHLQLFPVQYSDDFFSKAVQGVGLYDQELFSVIATTPDVDSCIIGFVLAQLIPIEKCEDKDVLDASSPAQHVCYILTLGLVPSSRRTGLGSELLRRCVEFAESYRTCGMVLVL